jgi:hypothetical protein
MKPILLVSSLLLLAGCSTKHESVTTGDPVGVPYIVTLTAHPSSSNDAEVILNAEVQFGGFAYGQVKVDFVDGAKVLYTTSTETPVGANLQKFNYAGSFKASTGMSYNLKAIVTWSYAGGGRVESPVVAYP